MTYSLLIADRISGVMAVATASRSLAVGNAVPALLPGVGAVVSQAYTNRALRGHLLRELSEGVAPKDAVVELARVDDGLNRRQVGVLRADGAMAAHTGADCTDWAGHREGDGVLAVGNFLAGPHVLDAMVAAIPSRPGATAVELADRLLKAMSAGLRAGGDRRGQQSAAILVGTGPVQDTFPPNLEVDLRVDDHAQPLDELRRLLGAAQD